MCDATRQCDAEAQYEIGTHGEAEASDLTAVCDAHDVPSAEVRKRLVPA